MSTGATPSPSMTVGSILALVIVTTTTQCRSTGVDPALRPEGTSAATVTATATGTTDAALRAWDDPRAIAGLAASCGWTPWKSEQEKTETWFSCEGDLPSQACVYDPCFAGGEACKPGCASSCESCDQTCTRTCVPCEAACHDDTCRLACATTVASCKASCSSQRDTCVTAGCTAVYQACNARLRVAWNRSGCAAVCGKLDECITACETDACRDACSSRYKRQCPGDFEHICLLGDMTGRTDDLDAGLP